MQERQFCDFRKLQVWIKSRSLLLALFNATAKFPKKGSYDLTDRIRHDCLAIAANIVKAGNKLAKPETTRFFKSAWQAASNLEEDLRSAQYRGLLNDPLYAQFAREATMVKGMLAAYIK
ncbi:MAG: four helix bundle protein [bacterium]